jgi:hypothetical protein
VLYLFIFLLHCLLYSFVSKSMSSVVVVLGYFLHYKCGMVIILDRNLPYDVQFLVFVYVGQRIHVYLVEKVIECNYYMFNRMA